MDGDKVDVPALVAAVVRKFDLDKFRSDSLTKVKNHGSANTKSVPNEEAYCQQFYSIVTHALRNHPTWSVEARAQSGRADDRSLLDFILFRKDPVAR